MVEKGQMTAKKQVITFALPDFMRKKDLSLNSFSKKTTS